MTDLRTQLLSRYKVVSFFLEPNMTYTGFQVPSKVLCHWLDRFEDWFSAQCKEKPFLYYGRSVNINGTALLCCIDDLEELLACCTKHQLSVTLQLDFMSFYENYDIVAALCEKHSIGGLTIVAVEIDSDVTVEQMESFFQKVRSLRRLVTLVSSLDTIRKYHFFSSPALNGSDLTITFYEPDTTPETVSNPVCPCAERMNLCVCMDGLIYPCSGLTLLPGCSIGSVYSDEPPQLDDNLLELMLLGPDIPVEGAVSSEALMPWFCQRHRAELMSNE